MSFSAVGQVFDVKTFSAHLAGLSLAWADSVCIHHTAFPDLAMRPSGWTIQHMRNLANYYGSELGWSAGPHLFTDENQIFGLSPLTARGVHAASFNAQSIGIEMLGNYDSEDPMSGRGREVLETTAYAVACLLRKMGRPIDSNTVKFHRDDPKTKKSCPGKSISKDFFLGIVRRKSAELERLADQSDRIDDPALHEPVLTIEQRLERLEKIAGI